MWTRTAMVCTHGARLWTWNADRAKIARIWWDGGQPVEGCESPLLSFPLSCLRNTRISRLSSCWDVKAKELREAKKLNYPPVMEGQASFTQTVDHLLDSINLAVVSKIRKVAETENCGCVLTHGWRVCTGCIWPWIEQNNFALWMVVIFFIIVYYKR